MSVDSAIGQNLLNKARLVEQDEVSYAWVLGLTVTLSSTKDVW